MHVEDVREDPDYDPRTLEVLQQAAPYRTFLGIPILRNGVPIGAIGCGRRDVRPFTATQIELVKTFADQAVIAIENVAAVHGAGGAQPRPDGDAGAETATSEILRVISSSPTDVQPVLDAVAESARAALRCCRRAISGARTARLALAASHGELVAGSRAEAPSAAQSRRRPGRAILIATPSTSRTVAEIPE